MKRQPEISLRSILLHGEKRLFDFLINARIANGSGDYRKFVIAARMRTGTTYLRSLLASRVDMRVFDEVFDEYRIIFNAPGYRKLHFDNELLRLREKDPARFIDQVLYAPQPKRIKAVGFKALYHHTPQTAWQHLKEIDDIRIIHLKRRNYLRTFLSYKIAERDRRVSTVDPNLKIKKIHIDYDECSKAFSEMLEDERRHDEYFESLKKIDVFYEDLAEHPEHETKRIQLFLSVEPRPLRSSFKKLMTRPLSEAITNYSELQDSFKDSPWISFFED